jgi:hypothetical protein
MKANIVKVVRESTFPLENRPKRNDAAQFAAIRCQAEELWRAIPLLTSWRFVGGAVPHSYAEPSRSMPLSRRTGPTSPHFGGTKV